MKSCEIAVLNGRRLGDRPCRRLRADDVVVVDMVKEEAKMENEKSTENQILTGKMDRYSETSFDNFICPGEITVTITLNEYRRLVTDKAISKSEIAEKENERWRVSQEVALLKEENTALKEKIVNLAGGNDEANEGVADGDE